MTCNVKKAAACLGRLGGLATAKKRKKKTVKRKAATKRKPSTKRPGPRQGKLF